jgi:hypothetical protein
MTGRTFLRAGSVQILGLSGKARSGKDFLAEAVAVPMGFFPVALADHFKVDVVARSCYSPEEVWGAERSPEARQLLQEAGTEKGRDIYGPHIWCRALEAWIWRFMNRGIRRFVVTDVRFPNEVEWVHSLGGRVYRVTGRGGLSGGRGLHVSETALDDYRGFDRVINNARENEAAVKEQLRRALCTDFELTAKAA